MNDNNGGTSWEQVWTARQAKEKKKNQPKRVNGKAKPKPTKSTSRKKSHFMVSHKTMESREFKALTASAQVLFIHLCRLRNRLTKGKNKTPDFSFWRLDVTLMKDTGLPRNTLKRARKALVEAKFLITETLTVKPRYAQSGLNYTIIDDVYQKEMDKHRDNDSLKGIVNPLLMEWME